MKIEKLITLFFCGLIMILASSVSPAQEKFAQPERADAPNDRGQIFRELGLTQDQIRQIRLLRADRRPLMVEAQQKLRQAQRNLDQATYADDLDEAIIQTSLREFITAQSEMAALRATDELEMRKILTPEQLIKFRDLRQRALEMRNNIQQRRQNRIQNAPQQRPDRPNDRPNRPNDQLNQPQTDQINRRPNPPNRP